MTVSFGANFMTDQLWSLCVSSFWGILQPRLLPYCVSDTWNRGSALYWWLHLHQLVGQVEIDAFTWYICHGHCARPMRLAHARGWAPQPHGQYFHGHISSESLLLLRKLHVCTLVANQSQQGDTNGFAIHYIDLSKNAYFFKKNFTERNLTSLSLVILFSRVKFKSKV